MSWETAQFLSGSPDRQRLLSHLRETPGSPRDVADALDVAHRSAQRHLSSLVDRDWAEKRDGVYHLTTVGELVAEEHATYLDTLDSIDSLEPFYRHLPDSDHAPDPRLLADADVVVAAPDRPQAPVNHYISALAEFETDHIRMISPVLSRLFHQAHAELVVAGTTHDLVMSVQTARRAKELNAQEFALVIGMDQLRLRCVDGPVGFGLTLGDRRCIVHAYDEDGQLHALVDSTSKDLCAWAETLFERYRTESHPVENATDLDEFD